ncbi:flagellar biosynthesis anti-sigma factor FlgM [Dyella sp. LX-66]|jgi:negative regulator of flagellin synthesis FlgM|uniref:flagellar biosynthesis anti-sigma factor FlgM n=1 Tax=unclassified Dyella TaxID=2634549 RepID=UPI001BE0FB51|nr:MULTISPECIES: flagellar biosynthesis anti-sigma factor FlgM [unclassified Dyella]MBT2116016.1 flagellar biosynthesis anti-sigma factor FlgM [Dyella sp. LX-1]MBT2138026.1 flagellar biosynthesis anti-sigma factor FlgM [Dyella sp. LX-66]
MNTTITSNGLPVLPQAKGNQNAQAQASQPATEAAPAAKADDSVKLTESARALTAAQGDKAPAIDTKRVEQIRAAIADGSYRVDAGKIADGLISMEGQLSGKP